MWTRCAQWFKRTQALYEQRENNSKVSQDFRNVSDNETETNGNLVFKDEGFLDREFYVMSGDTFSLTVNDLDEEGNPRQEVKTWDITETQILNHFTYFHVNDSFGYENGLGVIVGHKNR